MAGRADECQQFIIAELSQIVLIPLLATLIKINRLEKIIRRRFSLASTIPEIGDR